MSNFITPLGTISIIIIGHSSMLIQWNGNNIFTDPYSKVASYANQPKANLVLITHDHYDHMDQTALKQITDDKTIFVTSQNVQKSINEANALKQGDEFDYKGLKIKAVYAYNIVQKREDGKPFHSRGEGNGYILNFGGYRIYVAGDTELIPEMKELGAIDIAFLPKNLPYTMSDEMFIEAVKTIKPKVVFPYHYFELDEEAIKSKLPEGVIMYTK